MKRVLLLMLALSFALVFAACSASTESTSTETETASENTSSEKPAEDKKDEKDTIIIAWYPNESGADLKDSRDALGKIIEEATGKKVEHKTTTDYIIAIESIANGNADLAFMGAQGYIEAHNKNDKVLPLVVSSGASGTLDDAVYYSWLNVKKGNEDAYKDGDTFSIDNIVDKKFSFVSNSSTSGFKVPSSGIVAHFSKQDSYKDLTADDLLEGGAFFSEVLYGGSHQGSAVNLLTGKADVAAFCDVCVKNYIELAEGEWNRPGAVYQVLADAAEPFNTVPGEQFVSISVTPVLNAPFVVNTETVSEEDIAAIKKAYTSDKVANDPTIFVPKDSETKGLFSKSENERFLEVDDAWFNPVRELSGN
ncbi:PhnD/SsuA/transferrin family substrate-binding protein [Bacillus salitolerans]|uniref:PhnD/SsuA/transferrin family substrate-binding protein n=1 Tax=Bacillus salitolerans TaxID=1437434 RepID=A0ABW4LJR3_9BACI